MRSLQNLKLWRDKNKEKLRAQARSRYAKNREKMRKEALLRYWANPEKHRASSKRWKKKNAERVKQYARLNSVRYLYGLSFDEYSKMESEQNGLCAICKELPKRCRLAVDHNHKTGKVRELLCIRCNFLVAAVENNENLGTLAIEYLRKHRAS